MFFILSFQLSFFLFSFSLSLLFFTFFSLFSFAWYPNLKSLWLNFISVSSPLCKRVEYDLSLGIRLGVHCVFCKRSMNPPFEAHCHTKALDLQFLNSSRILWRKQAYFCCADLYNRLDCISLCSV